MTKCKLLGFNEKNSDLIYRTGDNFFRYNPISMINPIEIDRQDATYLSSIANDNVDIVMDDYEEFLAIIEKYAIDNHNKHKDNLDPEFMTDDQVTWWIEEIYSYDLMDSEAKKIATKIRKILEFNQNIEFMTRSECQKLLTVAEFYG